MTNAGRQGADPGSARARLAKRGVEKVRDGTEQQSTPRPVAELLARTRASLRRKRVGRAATDSVFHFGAVELDMAARIVKKRQAEVRLNAIEYRLLCVPVANTSRVLTHP